jgi:PAS domain S-box-containing protein
LRTVRQPDPAFLTSVLDVVTAAVIVVDTEWRYTYLNAAALAQVRRPLDELLGHVIWEVLPHLAGGVSEESARRASQEQTRVSCEDYDAAYDQWLEATAYPIPNGLVWVTRDITERKRADVKLHDALQTQRALIDASPLPIIVIARSGAVTIWNAAAERVFGWTAEETIGGPLPFIPPDKRAEHALMRQKDLSGTGFIEREIDRVRKDGTPVALSVSTAPVKGADGAVAGIISVYQDISARKAAESMLRLQARVLDSMTEGVSVATDDGVITYTNPAEDRMFGYGPGELAGQHVTVQNAYPAEENAARVDQVIQQLRQKGVWAGEWQNRRKDGSTFFTEARITALEQEGRKYFVCVQQDVTDKRQAHERLSESEMRLRMAIDAAQLGVWEWDIVQHRVTWSDRVYEIHGLPPGSLSGDPEEIGRLFHPDDRGKVTNAVLRALQEKSGYSVEFRIVRPDGTIRWISTTGKLLCDDSGRPVRMLGTTLDTSEHHVAAEQVRASEERLDLAARAGQIGTFDWDIQTGRVIWTEQEQRLFGLVPGTFEGTIEGWARRVHPEDVGRVTAQLSEAMNAHVTEVSFEFRIIRPDGEVRNIEGAGRFMYDDDGVPVRMVGVNIDVTARRMSEHALRESDERQRLAADAGKVGIWDWDIGRNKVVWSDRIYEFHGVERGSFGGTVEEFGRLVHPDDQERVSAALKGALEDRLPYEVEFRTVRPDGTVRWLSTSARVLYNDAGSPVRMLGATLDTTERRDYEERLRRSNEELEEFAFVASHDLQEPLRMVNAYTELLLRRLKVSEDPDIQDYRRYIHQGVQRMQELIQDLLAYSRVIHADGEASGTASLQQALDKAKRVLAENIAAAGAHITSEALPLVRGEEPQLEQVFQNLLSNSLKYRHPERQPEVRISASTRDHECIVSVEDNGIGFEQKYAMRVFKLFKRLHKDEYPGTGLGLAICKRIVERHGGRIWAEGVPGQGCRFHFTLPLAPGGGDSGIR